MVKVICAEVTPLRAVMLAPLPVVVELAGLKSPSKVPQVVSLLEPRPSPSVLLQLPEAVDADAVAVIADLDALRTNRECGRAAAHGLRSEMRAQVVKVGRAFRSIWAEVGSCQQTVDRLRGSGGRFQSGVSFGPVVIVGGDVAE